MSLIKIDGLYMTRREVELNQARMEGRSAYRYYDSLNPYLGVDEGKAAAWNDGWNQATNQNTYYW